MKRLMLVLDDHNAHSGDDEFLEQKYLGMRTVRNARQSDKGGCSLLCDIDGLATLN